MFALSANHGGRRCRLNPANRLRRVVLQQEMPEVHMLPSPGVERGGAGSGVVAQKMGRAKKRPLIIGQRRFSTRRRFHFREC